MTSRYQKRKNKEDERRIMSASTMLAYIVATSLFLLDPFLLYQKRLRKRQIMVHYMRTNPLRRQLRREHFRVSRPSRGKPPYTQHNFNLQDKSDTWCLEFLRFTKHQLRELVRAFQLDHLQLPNRCKAPAETCLSVLLFRLAFPNRYKSCCDVS